MIKKGWVQDYIAKNPLYETNQFHCSECNFKLDHPEIVKYYYFCPKCGEQLQITPPDNFKNITKEKEIDSLVDLLSEEA